MGDTSATSCPATAFLVDAAYLTQGLAKVRLFFLSARRMSIRMNA
jgi:hypothetical protein